MQWVCLGFYYKHWVRLSMSLLQLNANLNLDTFLLLVFQIMFSSEEYKGIKSSFRKGWGRSFKYIAHSCHKTFFFAIWPKLKNFVNLLSKSHKNCLTVGCQIYFRTKSFKFLLNLHFFLHNQISLKKKFKMLMTWKIKSNMLNFTAVGLLVAIFTN